jgi:UDP-N-acetylglucosamine 1-carboxyvinyltransferase
MFVVTWWKDLSGKITIWGSKNAVLKLIPAALLFDTVTLQNVPRILDVDVFLSILSAYGIKHTFLDEHTLFIDSRWVKNATQINTKHFSDIRASIMLLSPILQKLWNISIPLPWGDKIGKRPIDTHTNGLKKIGYKVQITEKAGISYIEAQGKSKKGDITINGGFSVTGTENLIISNVLRSGKTTIKNAAIEPHVMCLIDFLRKWWAQIAIRYDHTIIITGVVKLTGNFNFPVIPDYLVAGTFMIIAALKSKTYIDIKNACIPHLYSFIEKLKEAWVVLEDLWKDTLRVYRAKKLKAVQIQTNIFPGFPSDLQSPFAVLMTQAQGISRIHEVLYESRLNWLVELEKMWAHLAILNPHEAMIFGKTDLRPDATVTSWDLRAGATMVIAWLLAKGKTHITNIDYIKRGYEGFVDKLKALWADIEDLSDTK